MQGYTSYNIVDSAITLKDSANLDAFSRLRVSNPLILFNSQFTYDLNPILFQVVTSGSGFSATHDAVNRCANLSLTAAGPGSRVYMQSYEYIPYQPGRSQLIFMTFNMISGDPLSTKFAGYSDGVNGIEFQVVGDGLSSFDLKFVLYSNTSAGDEIVIQSNWNLDTLDGNGPSGINIDITKTQILVIDVQALYTGRVRIGFDIGGEIIYAHEFLHANLINFPYIATANLPVRCGMTCPGGGTTTSMKFICAAVMSEGGADDVTAFGYTFTTNASVTASTLGTQVMTLRPKILFNGLTNRMKVSYIDVEIFNTGTTNQHVRWDLCVGQAITGGTWADVNTTYSGVEVNTGGTLSGSPAVIIDSGWSAVGANTKTIIHTAIVSKYPITLDWNAANRVMGSLTLKVTSLSGSPVVYGAVKYKEIR